jgi:DNA (cytosine-5)-methyltransferase 1
VNELAHNNPEQLRTFHLFAGAGGGILADLLLGHIPVGACEIEDYPRAVLLQRQRDGILPEFPIWDDIRTLDGKPWRGLVDVLSFGFPCQDISSAGKSAGLNGGKSCLYFEAERIAGEIRPRHLFMENSPNLTTRGLNRITAGLAEMGYDCRWCVIGGNSTGTPQLRERIWILGELADSVRGKRSVGWDIPRSIWELELDAAHLDRKAKSEPAMVGMVDGLADGMGRNRAIGNGQISSVAALAWQILTEGLTQ